MWRSFNGLKRCRKGLIPFLTAGFPTPTRCLGLLRAMADAGADAIELGIPFSDPLADGPIIQKSSQEVLAQGITLEDAFILVERFHRTHDTPIFFMSYVNPLLQWTFPRFFARARRHLTGVVVADLPPEEAESILLESCTNGIPLIFLCSPTCTDERIRLIHRNSQSFIYLVSLKGITGTRASLSPGLFAFIRHVRGRTDRPLYVGFGISTPRQAAAVAEVADGVIVGSALIRLIEEGGGPREVFRFVSSLRKAVK